MEKIEITKEIDFALEWVSNNAKDYAFIPDMLLAFTKDYNKTLNQSENVVLDDVMPRSFGMVRWYENVQEDVACMSIAKAQEYVDKYNKLAGEEKCYVDEEVFLLLSEA